MIIKLYKFLRNTEVSYSIQVSIIYGHLVISVREILLI